MAIGYKNKKIAAKKSALNEQNKKENLTTSQKNIPETVVAKPSIQTQIDSNPSISAAVKNGSAITITSTKQNVVATQIPQKPLQEASESDQSPLQEKQLPTEIPPKVSEKTDSTLQNNLAQSPLGSITSNLRIFQIYYEDWQRELLDPAYTGINNSKDTSELLEFSVFERLAISEHVKGAKLWGALSWRFSEKTGMPVVDWVKAIAEKPGYDLYFCNPFPHNEALFHNYWLQGETTHPQFVGIVNAVLEVFGVPVDELISMLPSDQYSAANYFVGSPMFWNSYLPWVKNFFTLVNKKLPPNVRDLLHSAQADDRGIHKGATYVPFIVERLLPLFLKTQGKNLKVLKITLPEREKELNVHLRMLREMKDVAHKTKSPWLAACWLNYRNLYMTQTNTKEWCDKYLRKITPTEVKFYE
jgi:hypothetical protein